MKFFLRNLFILGIEITTVIKVAVAVAYGKNAEGLTIPPKTSH